MAGDRQPQTGATWRTSVEPVDFAGLRAGSLLAVLGADKPHKFGGARALARHLTARAVRAQRIGRVLVMCDGEVSLREWGEAVPPRFVMPADLDTLRRLYEHQKKFVEGDMRHVANVDEYPVPACRRLWLVLDTAGVAGFNSSELVRQLQTDCRHVGIDLVMVARRLYQIGYGERGVQPPPDYVCMTLAARKDDVDEARAMCEAGGGDALSARQFRAVFECVTQARDKALWVDTSRRACVPGRRLFFSEVGAQDLPVRPSVYVFAARAPLRTRVW